MGIPLPTLDLTGTMPIVVRQSVRLPPGLHRLSDQTGEGVLVIAGNEIVLDGAGAILDGLHCTGVGIVIRGRARVWLRNLTVRGFRYAIVAEDCQELLIEDCDLSGNAGGDDGQWLDILAPLETTPGGGLLLHRVTASVVRRVVAREQDVGINLMASHGNRVEDCDCSNNTAWGIRLWASCDNVVVRNRALRVNRCSGAGCDAAGILLTGGSHRNQILGNDLRFSGDGFFLGNQFSPPNNDNRVVGNDGSDAVHNAFEATFSRGNVFRSNRACRSNYGFWLGFSVETTVEGNVITDNRTDGIHWEHGQGGLIRANLIARNGRYGVALTLNPANHDFPDRTVSTRHVVRENVFRQNRECGIYLLHTTATVVHDNEFIGNRRSVCEDGTSHGNMLELA
ncbi:MAG: right-handed parallel beta-helix repeat-containing protein [Thermorudis peleae]|nr:right-handed parallel beta-helix repeat-containing protein [Thermorudis peleae]